MTTWPDQRLSQITTLWGDFRRAHQASEDDRRDAQRRLLERYGAAIYRYLLGALRDPEMANELFQEFALRFVRGDLGGADPGRGRFRDYLKRTLANLVCDHWRQQTRRTSSLPAGDPGPATAPSPDAEADAAFLTAWRDDLLADAWDALEADERASKHLLHTVLRLRADDPEASIGDLAARLAGRLGRVPPANWVYKRLHRARARFAELLIESVAASPGIVTRADLEAELADLNLLESCRPALRRRRGGA